MLEAGAAGAAAAGCAEQSLLRRHGTPTLAFWELAAAGRIGRLRPDTAELAAGHAAQANEAPGSLTQATEMPLLLLCWLLPGGVANRF